jgi:hypothetical protein
VRHGPALLGRLLAMSSRGHVGQIGERLERGGAVGDASPENPCSGRGALLRRTQAAALLHRRALDFLQALVGDEFRAARRSHTLDDWAMCCASPSPR